jgi:hypothetical protein
MLAPVPIAFKPGRYEHLLIRCFGVPNALAVVAPDFPTNIYLKKDGLVKANIPLNRLQQVDDLIKGRPASDFVAGVSYNQSFVVPFAPIGQVNAIDVRDSSEWYLEYDAIDDPVNPIVSGFIRASGRQSYAAERFAPIIAFQTRVMTGDEHITLPTPNLSMIVMFFSAGATPPTNVIIRRKMLDGSNYEETGTWQDYLDESNMESLIEAAASTGVLRDLNPTREQIENLSDEASVQVIGGVGTFSVAAFGAETEPARSQLSLLTVERESIGRVQALAPEEQKVAEMILGVTPSAAGD